MQPYSQPAGAPVGGGAYQQLAADWCDCSMRLLPENKGHLLAPPLDLRTQLIVY